MSTPTSLLILDDNPADHALIRRLLGQDYQRRYVYHEAELAASALAIMATTPIDCLLLDYSLPDSDGLEVLAALRNNEGGPTATAVIMLTGMGDEALAVQALQGGAMDYLVKDRLSGPHLARAIGEAIHHHRLRAELHARQSYLEQHTRELEQRVAALQESLAEELGRAELLVALEAERASLAQRVAESTADLRQANAELAQASRLKDEFLANMSHELRTPLNAVLGRAELLREQLYGPLTPQQDRAVQAIEEAGQHLLALINDVLDLSKVEAGTLTLEIEPVDVEKVTYAALRMVGEAAVAKQITLTTEHAGWVGEIRGDARRLKQILVNLLANAVKFTPAGGKVGLVVSSEAQFVCFTVWDTGIGILAEDQQRLFKPFVQLDSALNRLHEGTGLGLAMVHRLVQLHGGSVSLESTVGQGSRFEVLIPRADQPQPRWLPALDPNLAETQPSPRPDVVLSQDAGGPQPEALAAARAVQPEGRALILLVEDNLLSATPVRDYLAALGYRIALAGNGEEAVAQAEHLRPALILIDIQLPFVAGLEAIRRIRAAGMRDTKIIALTALAMPSDRERCLAAGADDYLTKPVSLRTLRTLIERMLR